jgi:hypothetical protein
MNFFQCIGNGTGGGAVLITKNISDNGVYNASADNADGFSRVVVNVPKGGYNAAKFEIISTTYTTQ